MFFPRKSDIEKYSRFVSVWLPKYTKCVNGMQNITKMNDLLNTVSFAILNNKRINEMIHSGDGWFCKERTITNPTISLCSMHCKMKRKYLS